MVWWSFSSYNPVTKPHGKQQFSLYKPLPEIEAFQVNKWYCICLALALLKAQKFATENSAVKAQTPSWKDGVWAVTIVFSVTFSPYLHVY